MSSSERRAISVLPVLSWKDLLGGANCEFTGVMNVGSPAVLNSGSAAILAALQLAGVGSGSSVLVPAFNCPSMVDAVVACGARPVFYRIGLDLGIDVWHIRERLEPDTGAVLVPHLFTRVQELAPIRNLCDERAVVLIEDCAHALFGTVLGSLVGSVGHYAIASPRKFLPLLEGGLLASGSLPIDLPAHTPRPSLAQCGRMLFDSLDVAVQGGQLRTFAPLIATTKYLSDLVRGSASNDRGARDAPSEIAAQSRRDVHVAHAGAPTRLLLQHCLTDNALCRRHANYEYLVRGLKTMSGIRMLEPRGNPPSFGTVPYMLPVILDEPAQQFAALKRLKVPIWRWEHSVRGQCEVADLYAEALIQLPCHQALHRADLDWILNRIESALAESMRARGAISKQISPLPVPSAGQT